MNQAMNNMSINPTYKHSTHCNVLCKKGTQYIALHLYVPALLSVILLASCHFLYAQKKSHQNIPVRLQQLLEDQAQEERSIDQQQLLDNLRYYLNHPIDLNNADRQTFYKSGILSQWQINDIITYRKKMGGFVQVKELSTLPSFRATDFSLIAPFFTLSSTGNQRPKTANHELIGRMKRTLETRRGYKDNNYGGDPWKGYLRYRGYNYKKWEYGITLEKDPGELWWDTNPDFVSFHLACHPGSTVKSIYIGDYALQFGQGLIQWNGFSMHGQGIAYSAAKQAAPVQAYRSVNVSNHKRGSAIVLKKGPWELINWYSRLAVSGNQYRNDTISGIDITGLHRTTTEKLKKHNTTFTDAGSRLYYNSNHLTLGVTGNLQQSDHYILPSPELRNKHTFRGKELLAGGIDYKWYHQNNILFGEHAINDRGKHAHISGILWPVVSGLNISYTYRYYSPGYFAFSSQAFGRGSTTGNETGHYISFESPLSHKFIISGYVHAYQFPWIRFQSNSPSTGREGLADLRFCNNCNASIQLRYRYREEEVTNTADDGRIRALIPSIRHQFRAHLTWEPDYRLQLQSRIALTSTRQDTKSKGWLMFQNLRYQFHQLPLTLTGRVTFFSTTDFASAVYTFENNVLYSFSIPALYDTGYRSYLMTKFSITQTLDFWIRYAHTRYTDRTHIGSAYQRINGNQQNDITFQFYYTF